MFGLDVKAIQAGMKKFEDTVNKIKSESLKLTKENEKLLEELNYSKTLLQQCINEYSFSYPLSSDIKDFLGDDKEC